MAVQWINPVPNLWYAASPTPGYITYDPNLNQYRLCMSEVPGNYVYAAPNLAMAQSEYEKEATELLITNPVLLQPTLMVITTPSDGQVIAFAKVDGTFGTGIYSASENNIVASAAVVDAGEVHSWSPLPPPPPDAPAPPSPPIRV